MYACMYMYMYVCMHVHIYVCYAVQRFRLPKSEGSCDNKANVLCIVTNNTVVNQITYLFAIHTVYD